MMVKEVAISDRRRRSGWFWIDNEIFDMDLNPTAFVVYCFLVRIADRSSEVACISIRKMAKLLNMSPITVQKAIKELEEVNMLRKLRRKTEKGNNLANLYQLTSKEEWKYPDQLAYQKMIQGVSKNDTGVCQKMIQGVSKNDTPCDATIPETIEPQVSEGSEQSSINNYNDQKSNYQKFINHHLIDDERKECQKKKIENKNEEYSMETYKRLLNKWEDALKNLELKRISDAQAVFFLENSALPVEKTIEAIAKDDGNPKVRDPIACLFSTLPLKSKRYKWLLKMENPQEQKWLSAFRKKVHAIIARCRELGIDLDIDLNLCSVSGKEDAEKFLTALRKKVYRLIWEKINPAMRKKFEERIESVKNKEWCDSVLELMVINHYKMGELFAI